MPSGGFLQSFAAKFDLPISLEIWVPIRSSGGLEPCKLSVTKPALNFLCKHRIEVHKLTFGFRERATLRVF